MAADKTDSGKDSPCTGRYVEVALQVPVDTLYTYLVPLELMDSVAPGVAVMVPVQERKVMGHVIRDTAAVPDAREILSLAPEVACCEPQTVALCAWAAAYYLHPPGEAVKNGSLAGQPVRQRSRYRLTEQGLVAIRSTIGPLSVQGLELSKMERAVLERLGQARNPLTSMVLLRETSATKEILERLRRRSFIERIDHFASSATRRKELFVRPTSALALLTPSERHRMGHRSPRMAELISKLDKSDEPLAVSQLRKNDAGVLKRVTRLKELGLVELTSKEVARDPFDRIPELHEPEVELNEQQRLVLSELSSALRSGGGSFLLHGVTGSGKTEVYLRLIAEAVKEGSQALVLVPEIALTPQLAGRFRARFPEAVAVLHSGLGQNERITQWEAIRQGRVKIVVGARSALFAPLSRLEVVIVDEEHDGSFKQQEGLRYHARDLAVVRGRQSKAVIVMGSATPSMESYQNSLMGRYRLLELPERATEKPLPVVEVVDLRKYQMADNAFTAPFLSALTETLAARQQAICFLNRRGFAPYLICKECGQTESCPHCSVSLTWHRAQNQAVCHYCGYTRSRPDRCSSCESPSPEPVGLGTERLLELLKDRFPGARIARLDRDTSSFGEMNHVLQAVRNRQVDILVGTQMITKGHHFPGVTLVGVVLADHGLNFPDFRAAERTFQLLCQVAGRAGRGDEPGRVIIQTYNPHHHAITCARTHDYKGFFRMELSIRTQLCYPPAGYLAAVRFDGPDPVRVAEAANRTGARIMEMVGRAGPVTVLGPSEAPLARLRGRTRWHLLLKSRTRKPLHEVLTAINSERKTLVGSDVRSAIDVDPQDMM